jgi:hypothetical protein
LLKMDDDAAVDRSGNTKNVKGYLKEIFASSKEDAFLFRLPVDQHPAVMLMYTRIRMLQMKELQQEAAFVEGEEYSVLHESASNFRQPLDAVNKLCDALGVDSLDQHGSTSIMCAAKIGHHIAVDFLARKKKADLSIININGENLYSIVGKGRHISQEKKEKTYHVLKEHGVTSASIIEGFRSPLSSITDSDRSKEKNLKELLHFSLDVSNGLPACQGSMVQVYSRIMKLPMKQLHEEAMWKEGDFYSVLHVATAGLGLPYDAIGRLTDAVGVDSLDEFGSTCIMDAAAYGK